MKYDLPENAEKSLIECARKHAPDRAHQLHIRLIDEHVVQRPPVRPDAHHPADLVGVRPVEGIRQLVADLPVAHQRKDALVAQPRQFPAVGDRAVQIKDDHHRPLRRHHVHGARLPQLRAALRLHWLFPLFAALPQISLVMRAVSSGFDKDFGCVRAVTLLCLPYRILNRIPKGAHHDATARTPRPLPA